MVGSVKIKDIRMFVTPFPAFAGRKTSTDDIAKMMIASPQLKSIYVVDDELKLVGRITLKKLIKQEFMDLIPSSLLAFDALEFIGKNNAESLMESPICVNDDDTLKTAFVKMYENDLDELPVVDRNFRLIGDIDMLELLTILIEKKEQKANRNYLHLSTNRPFH